MPLLVLAVVAQRATTSWSSLRSHLPTVRKVAGVVLGVATLAIAFNWLGALQRDVPGYTSALEDHIESTGSACTQLQHLSGEHQNQFAAANARLEGKKATCADHRRRATRRVATWPPGATTTTTTTPTTSTSPQKPSVFMANKTNLPNLGKAPNFAGITAWFNTPGDKPLSLSQLRGKVVLVDFWTYSCINCQRALPHVEGWYNDYKNDGLVVVGVSAPEFAFEHVVSNVESAAGNLGIDYPVAVDDNLATWDAYNNEYWPAEYLIDPTGIVRAYDFGEGGYSQHGGQHPDAAHGERRHRPPRTHRRPRQDTDQRHHARELRGRRAPRQCGRHRRRARTRRSSTTRRRPSPRTASPSAAPGPCTTRRRRPAATQRSDCSSRADDVYLVMSGEGTVGVSYNGEHLTTVPVSGIPKLYTLFSGTVLQTGHLTLTMSPGVEAYDFTFG